MRLVGLVLLTIGITASTSYADLPPGVDVIVTQEPELVYYVNPITKEGRWYVDAQVQIVVPDPSPMGYGAVTMSFPEYENSGQEFISDPLSPGTWTVSFHCPAPFGFVNEGGTVKLSTFFSGPGVYYSSENYDITP